MSFSWINHLMVGGFAFGVVVTPKTIKTITIWNGVDMHTNQLFWN